MFEKKIHYASTELDQMSKHATLKRLKFQIYGLFQSYGRGQYFWFVFFTLRNFIKNNTAIIPKTILFCPHPT